MCGAYDGLGPRRKVSTCTATGPPKCHPRGVHSLHRAFPCRDTVPRVWRNLWTLFLPRHQLELIGLLQQVTANCHRALAQVCNVYVCPSFHIMTVRLRLCLQVQATAEERYVQFCGKALRSRQRENYQRLLHRSTHTHTHTRASSTFNHHPHLGPSHCSLPTFRTTGYFCIAAVLSRAAQLAQPEEAARRAVR